MVAAGAEKITSGDLVVWCKVVAVAPAVVRRDGRVQADGRPCDHARDAKTIAEDEAVRVAAAKLS